MVDEAILAEVEELSHTLVRGEITVPVFEVLKETRDIDGLLNYLKGGPTSATLHKPSTSVRTESNNRLCLKDWFEQFEKL